MTWPSVSVVVLNWNGRQYLSDCLGSLEAQDYPGKLEIVLCDNASSDGSVDFVRANFPEVRVIVSDTNLGFGGGNNFAAEGLTSEAVAFLNNDTRVDPSWLRELASVLVSAEDIAAVGGKMVSWDGRQIDFLAGGATLTGFGLQLGWLGEFADRYGTERDILAPCGGSMLAWRERFLEIGGFDADYFLFYEDLDLGWRFWLRGWRVRSAPGSIAYHRHHGSVERVEDRRLAVLYERNALFTIYKNYDDPHLNEVLPAALILAAEKAMLLAAPDRGAFGLGPAARGKNRADPRLAAGRLDRVRSVVRRRGILETARRVPRALRSRLRPATARLRKQAARWIGGELAAGPALPPAAIATLLAIEQFGDHLPALRQKRAKIQAERRRPDEEILPLFGLPLEPLSPIAGFADYHRQVMKALGLDRWVSQGL